LPKDILECNIRIHDLAIKHKGFEFVIRRSGDGVFVSEFVSDGGDIAAQVIGGADFTVITVCGRREKDEINRVGAGNAVWSIGRGVRFCVKPFEGIALSGNGGFEVARH